MLELDRKKEKYILCLTIYKISKIIPLTNKIKFIIFQIYPGFLIDWLLKHQMILIKKIIYQS